MRNKQPFNDDDTQQPSDIEKIKSDYEYQINMMTSRIKQLQDQVEVSAGYWTRDAADELTLQVTRTSRPANQTRTW